MMDCEVVTKTIGTCQTDQVGYGRKGSLIKPASIHNEAPFKTRSECEMQEVIITLMVAAGKQTVAGRWLASYAGCCLGCRPEQATTVALIC